MGNVAGKRTGVIMRASATMVIPEDCDFLHGAGKWALCRSRWESAPREMTCLHEHEKTRSEWYSEMSLEGRKVIS